MDWYQSIHCEWLAFMKYQAKKLFDTLLSFLRATEGRKKFNGSINYFDTICEASSPPHPSYILLWIPSESIFFLQILMFSRLKSIFCNFIPQLEKNCNQRLKLLILKAKNLVHFESDNLFFSQTRNFPH